MYKCCFQQRNIDQIDNISDIATSFSDFAKMPLPKNELFEIFSDLELDYTLIEVGEITGNYLDNNVKALNGTSYRFFHKGQGVVEILDVDYGFTGGYTFNCRYQTKQNEKANVFVDFEASVNTEKELFCIVLREIGICANVELHLNKIVSDYEKTLEPTPTLKESKEVVEEHQKDENEGLDLYR